MASGKVDNRSAFGSKRSRNDGSRSDGDWTCSQCGNVNFGFRIVCNRGQCGAERPQRTPQRMGSVPPAGPFDHPAPFYIGGAPPLPQLIPNGYGPPLRYNYAPSGNPAAPYSLLSAYPGPIGYGPRPMNGFGFGFQGSPLPQVSSPWAGGNNIAADNNASRKRRGGPDGLSEGDWVCPKCENVNFAFRTTCNMKKCAAPRPSASVASNQNQSSSGVPEGSWTCNKCENINYPFRTVCNRKGCGNDKPTS